MRIAFLIRRRSNLRLLGPIVDAALAAGADVECWPDYGVPSSGPKGYLFPHVDTLPAFRAGTPAVRPYADAGALADRVRAEPIGAVVSLTTWAADTAGAPVPRGITPVMVQSGPDTFHYPAGELAQSGLLALHSPWWLRWGAAHRAIIEGTRSPAAIEAALAPTSRYVGFPEAESVSLVDRDAVRRRWGIPAGQPVVVLLPFPQGVGRRSFWPKQVFGEPSRMRRVWHAVTRGQWQYVRDAWTTWQDADLVAALRAFCDRQGAFLLVKSREKTPVPPYLATVADRCVYDEGFYPPTIIEALSIASLCVSYYSLGLLEATAMGVPHLCVTFRAEDYLGPGATAAQRTYFDTFFTPTPGGPFHWPGVTLARSPREWIEALHRRTLADFAVNGVAQRAYREQYLGPDDGRCAARAVDAMREALVA